MDRRSFLTWAGLGALATSLPIALAACGANESSTTDAATTEEAPAPAATTTATDSFVAVGSASALEANGSISEGKFAGGSGKLIVFKDGENVIALDAKCPHAGCAVNWKDSELICPCHDSKFAADGSLISGPATEGLASFEAKIEGDQVLVKAS